MIDPGDFYVLNDCDGVPFLHCPDIDCPWVHEVVWCDSSLKELAFEAAQHVMEEHNV